MTGIGGTCSPDRENMEGSGAEHQLARSRMPLLESRVIPLHGCGAGLNAYIPVAFNEWYFGVCWPAPVPFPLFRGCCLRRLGCRNTLSFIELNNRNRSKLQCGMKQTRKEDVVEGVD